MALFQQSFSLCSSILQSIRSWHLCSDHVISTGRQMTNLVSNFECLFWFLFSVDIKTRSERSPIHSKLSLLSKGALSCPKFQNSAAVKNIIFKIRHKLVIWRPVEMTWSAPLSPKYLLKTECRHIPASSQYFTIVEKLVIEFLAWSFFFSVLARPSSFLSKKVIVSRSWRE